MKQCKTCRAHIVGEAASQSLKNLEKLLAVQGFVHKTIPDVAQSLGPMCERCLTAWSKELGSN
jgi:hypothetical protein